MTERGKYTNLLCGTGLPVKERKKTMAKLNTTYKLGSCLDWQDNILKILKEAVRGESGEYYAMVGRDSLFIEYDPDAGETPQEEKDQTR